DGKEQAVSGFETRRPFGRRKHPFRCSHRLLYGFRLQCKVWLAHFVVGKGLGQGLELLIELGSFFAERSYPTSFLPLTLAPCFSNPLTENRQHLARQAERQDR